jgi:hypothetical protein
MDDVRVDLVTNIFEKKQQIIVTRTFERLHGLAVYENYLSGESQNPALEKAIREEMNPQR